MMTSKILAGLASFFASLSGLILVGQATVEVEEATSWADVVDRIGFPAALIFAFMAGAFYFSRMIVKEVINKRLIYHTSKYFETNTLLNQAIVEELRTNRVERVKFNDQHRFLLDKYVEAIEEDEVGETEH